MSENRAPEIMMAHPKSDDRLGRRVMGWLKKHGRETTLAAVVTLTGAGAVHHATGVDLGGPIPVGAAVDSVSSAAYDGLVKLADSELQQEQSNLAQEKTLTESFFQPNGFQEGGQIEINIAKLSEARTKEILLAIRLGQQDYEKLDVSKIISVDGLSAEPNLRLTIDNPTMVDLTAHGLGMYYTSSITTAEGTESILVPQNSVSITKPGKLKPLSAVTEITPLDVVHRISPTQ